jgi:hypothetical protein
MDLVILGAGKTVMDYPVDDPAEVWGVNWAYKKVPRRLDKIFFFDKPEIFGIDTLKGLEYSGVKLVHKREIEGLNIEIFPIDKIVKDLNTDYFANTVCYMIAYAIWKGYKRIRTFGVDMSLGKELCDERPCMEYWVGYARAKGIEVIISKGS